MLISGIPGTYFRIGKYSDFFKNVYIIEDWYFSLHPHSPLTEKAQVLMI